jgi:hypothetical protein
MIRRGNKIGDRFACCNSLIKHPLSRAAHSKLKNTSYESNAQLTWLGSTMQFSGQLVWHVPLALALPHPQLIFPFKTWFFGIYLNFQQQKSLKNQYLSHSESKSYQIIPLNPAYQDLSNDTKGTFQFF